MSRSWVAVRLDGSQAIRLIIEELPLRSERNYSVGKLIDHALTTTGDRYAWRDSEELAP